MAAFFSAWFSYLVILFLLTYAALGLWLRTMVPHQVFYMLAFLTGGWWILILLGAATVLAFISKYDPLGWLWSSIGQAIA